MSANGLVEQLPAAAPATEFQIVCTSCQALLSIAPAQAGLPAKCESCQTYVIAPRTRFAPGVLLGDFLLQETLGTGGRGVVFRACQRSLDRTCALKILHAQPGASAADGEELLQEARVAARLNHPNIVQCYTVGEEAGVRYYAMEYVEGRTLLKLLQQKGKLPPLLVLEVMRQVIMGLDYAWHRDHVVHRDLKPENIMLGDDGAVKLADLGLACAMHETPAGQDDVFFGTPHYLCPEQILGTPMDFRGDMYSLGIVMFFCLTGNRPFNGKNGEEIVRRQLEDQAPPIQEFSPDCPPALCRVVARMMAKEPQERYADYQALLGALAEAEADCPDTPAGHSTTLHLLRRERQNTNRPSSPNRLLVRRPAAAASLPAGLGAGAPASLPVPAAVRETPSPAGSGDSAAWLAETVGTSASEPVVIRRTARRRQWLLLAALLVVPTLVGAALGLVLYQNAHPRRSASPPPALDPGAPVADSALARPALAKPVDPLPPSLSPAAASLSPEAERDVGRQNAAATLRALRQAPPAWSLSDEADAIEKLLDTLEETPPATPAEAKALYDKLQARGQAALQQARLRQDAETLRDLVGERAKLAESCQARQLAPGVLLGAMAASSRAQDRSAAGDYQAAAAHWNEAAQRYGEAAVAAAKTGYETALGARAQVLADHGGADWDRLQAALRTSASSEPAAAVAAWRQAQALLPAATAAAVADLWRLAQQAQAAGDARLALVCLDGLLAVEPAHRGADVLRETLRSNYGLTAGQVWENSLGMAFAYVPPGNFRMGSPAHEPGRDADETPHDVTIARGFFLGSAEITQKQWREVMGANYRPAQGLHPGDAVRAFQGDELPKHTVSWHEAQRFCEELTRREGRRYRLPTEAEWEYACRAGTRSAYNVGRDALAVGEASVYFNAQPGGDGPRPVRATGKPNAWGLWDMHGNVWEWCSDWSAPYAPGSSADPGGPAAPGGPPELARRIVRGGSWFDEPDKARSANRWEYLPAIGTNYIGFRVVLHAADVER